MSRFAYCMRKVLQEEGGVADHEADKGKLTNHGVTTAAYERYRDSILQPRRSVTQIEQHEVEDIYYRYWQDCRADDLPAPLDLLVFDCAINSGPGKSISLLQRVFGLPEVGMLGPLTRDAVSRVVQDGEVIDLCERYIKERRQFYRNRVALDKTQEVFFAGWNNRLDHMAKELEA